jgi:phosphoglycerate dehydrogenase-like enzyme
VALPRCVILDDYQNAALEMADWSPLGDRVEVVVLNDHIADRAALIGALEGAAIVVAMRERTVFDRALIERLPDLRLLVTTGMKNASIDVAAAADAGITVCGTGGSAGATAELTWGLILALLRHIPRESAAMAAGGRWQSTLGRELAGRVLGVVGFGRLGGRVARVGLAFGMEVRAFSRSLTPEAAAGAGVGHCARLDDLLSTCDIVSVHVTLTDQSRGLIGARELGLMKPRAVLVNTSRGPIVEEAALAAALSEGRLAGAAVDVYDTEPLPAGHPFLALDNILTTPHIGYVTEETYRVFFGEAVEDIAAWLDGTPVRVIVGD